MTKPGRQVPVARRFSAWRGLAGSGWMRIAAACLVFCGFVAEAQDGEEQEPAEWLWQPVQEYFTVIPPADEGRQTRRHEVNPFFSYTHIGTDFGFIGPAEEFIGWAPGMVWAQLPESPDGWAGMWHSLAGLARMTGETLNAERPWAPWIAADWQPKIRAVRLRALGKANLKLEIKGSGQEDLWVKQVRIDSAELVTITEPLDAASIPAAKLLNWIAEPGSDVLIDSLGFELEPPKLSFAQWVFALSYAKASRCYSPATGLVRDRAHTEEGAFDSIPATGLFVLATAAAAEEGMVTREFARETAWKSWRVVFGLRGPHGLLPHFSRNVNGHPRIHPGTEYSTVDSAIFFQSLLLAGAMLKDDGLVEEVLRGIRGVNFAPLRDKDGFISHGTDDTGNEILPYNWKDWGGETALVLLLQAMSAGEGGEVAANMAPTGHVHQGAGFIAEIQSLLYPDFDQETPDRVSRVNWREARESLLSAQKRYFVEKQPEDGFARSHHLFGLSAGEGAYGLSYQVGGSDLPDQELLHPHYVLMSAGLEESSETTLALLRRMRELDLMPAWGLVENFFADGSGFLPMQGGLNAGFESVAAYHLLKRVNGETDAIYNAALNQADIRKAMRVFYPGSLPAGTPAPR